MPVTCWISAKFWSPCLSTAFTMASSSSVENGPFFKSHISPSPTFYTLPSRARAETIGDLFPVVGAEFLDKSLEKIHFVSLHSPCLNTGLIEMLPCLHNL